MNHIFRVVAGVLVLVVGLARVASAIDDASSDALKSAIEKIVVTRMGQERVASYAIGIVKDGRVALARGFGFADLENDVPATADTVYRIGSMTKQFTSMGVMLLAEQGKLSIDDEMTKYLPDYPLQGHKVTVHHLLNHTSGIKSLTEMPAIRTKHSHMELTREEQLGWFQNEPFDFEPGARWKYNNSGYWLLGLIIEKASGQSYSDFVAAHIFRPLNMAATRMGDLRPLIPHRAAGYRDVEGQLANADVTNMSLPGAAGALVSSVTDLIKWHLALEESKLISLASYEAIYRPTKLASGETAQYGYGWNTGDSFGHRKLSHGGSIQGFRTFIARYPVDRVAIVVLSNTESANVGAMERQIAKVVLGVAEEPIVDLPTDAQLLKSLVAKYQLGAAPFEITSDDGSLYLKRPGGSKERLKYQGNHLFVFTSDPDFRVRFNLKDGQAESFELETPDQKSVVQRAE